MTMRLSDAIRLGSMLSPPGFDGWMDTEARCALAAACDAVGVAAVDCGGSPGIDYSGLYSRWPVLVSRTPTCPMCQTFSRGLPVGVLVAHLNDWHRWSRERIADWVETLESAFPQADGSPASQRCGTTETEVPVLTSRVKASS